MKSVAAFFSTQTTLLGNPAVRGVIIGCSRQQRWLLIMDTPGIVGLLRVVVGSWSTPLRFSRPFGGLCSTSVWALGLVSRGCRRGPQPSLGEGGWGGLRAEGRSFFPALLLTQLQLSLSQCTPMSSIFAALLALLRFSFEFYWVMLTYYFLSFGGSFERRPAHGGKNPNTVEIGAMK